MEHEALAEIRGRALRLLVARDASPSPSFAKFLTDGTVRRYAVANEWDHEAAAKQLESTWHWRAATRPDQMVCELCLRTPMSHSLRPVGFDALGRLVLYTCFATAHDRFESRHAMAHMTRMLDDAQILLDAQPARFAPKWVLVIDFHGFSVRDADPRNATHTAWLLRHFPERLALAVVYDAGLLFNGVWRVTRRLLNATTVARVCFTRQLDSDDPTLRALGPEMLAWLTAEAAENRTMAAHTKRWWDPDLAAGAHDARGLGSFLRDPVAWDAFYPYADHFVDACGHFS
jgi:hypothetical protein